MSTRFAATAFVALTLAFAGCLGGKGTSGNPPVSSETGTVGSTSESMTSTTTSSPTEIAEPLPFELRMNDCKGVRSLYEWPGDTAPAGREVPPGWEQSNPPFTDHQTKILECGRISVGPFERGPIRFLLETHNKAKVPTACLEYGDGARAAEVIRTIWFDDEEIASYLIANWSMPVHVGIFSYEETNAGSVSVRKWTWGERDGPISELDYSRAETSEGGSPFIDRYFWHDGKSVSMIDMNVDDHQPLVTPYQSTGWFRFPMMQAEAGVEAYAGVSALVDPGASYVGTFQKFGDLECKDPLP